MQVLVLGGSGFLGSHLVEGLLREGHHVRSVSRHLPGLLPVSCLNHPRFEGIEGDLGDPAGLRRFLDGVDVCFHLVSTTLPHSSNNDPIFDVHSNLVGTLQLLEEARQIGLPRLIFVSSGGTVYGVPSTVPITEDHPTAALCSYGITKRAIEQYLELYRHLHGLDSWILRLANPYGERQRIVASQGAVAVFLGKILRGEPIELWGDGSTVRDFLYVGDAIEAMLRLLTYQGEQRLFNIGSGRGCSLNQLIHTIAGVTQRQPRISHLPFRGFDVPSNVLCIERAGRELAWQPRTSLRQGIEAFHRSLN